MCYMAARAGKVGVRELRQNLSVYLERVKKGQALLVTEHGRVVAQLAPPAAESDPVARLIASGAIRPRKLSPADLPRPLQLTLDRPLSDVLNELRADKI